jgi:rifampicin phosphotransferase
MSQTWILSFEQIDRHSLAAVGGKGANLGELTRAGLPVPPGFCVTTGAYRAFVAPVEEALFARLEGLDAADLDAARRAGREVRAMLEALALPAALEEALRAEWARGGAAQAYAVRSSATAEDLPTASFAGQQDTYLNVIGAEALLERVRACFISLFTDRAILYRIQNSFPHRLVALSVVVQQLVRPALSGILFTADPITERRDLLSIDASYGLGEALVSGLVSADLYKVDRRSGAIAQREIARKRIAIMPLEAGGTETVEVAEADQTRAALSDAQIHALAALGEQIEAHYGRPQDIEWAIEGERLWITQSRPITSLYPLPAVTHPGERGVFMSLSHLQVMTDPMPPLTISMWRRMPPVGLDAQGECWFIQGIGGRLYADVGPLLRHPAARRVLLTALGVADVQIQQALRELAARPELMGAGSPLRLAALAPLLAVATRVPRALFWSAPTGALEQVNAMIRAHVAAQRSSLLDPARPLEARLEEALRAMRGVVPVAGQWMPRVAAGIIAQRLLRALVGEREAALLNDLERGSEGNVVTQMNLALGDLADHARRSPAALAWLEAKGDEEAVAAFVASDEAGATFEAAWRGFLEEYGARGASEIDISRPRWREAQRPLAQMVWGMTHQAEPGGHRRHYDALIAASHAAARALPARVSALKRPLVRRLIAVSCGLIPLREHHKFFMVQVLDVVKRVMLEAGERMVARGQLEALEDVWMLETAELERGVAEPGWRPGARIAQRREALAHDARKAPPRVVTSDGEVVRPTLSAAGSPAGALIGSPVSAGVYEGVVHVIRDPAVEMLEPGEVLVAPFTDPGWTPLFVNAAALVTEVGGLMTHGSVVAREYGIPAVVGVSEATSRLRSGDVVRVHGDAGYVEIVQRGPR